MPKDNNINCVTSANNCTIYVSDALSFLTVPNLSSHGNALIKQTSNPIFDFSKVTLADNAGVALLVSWTRYAQSINKKILFINLPQQLLDLTKASNLGEFLPIV